MILYLIESRDRIFVKGYGFLFFDKNMGKNINKRVSKNLSGKYRWKRLDYNKQYVESELNTSSKSVIQTE